MLNFSANLSLLFTEVPLIQRFALAKQAGFDAVEIQFPYELTTEQVKIELEKNNLTLVLINVPAGDLMQGGDGLACVPSKTTEFANAVELACQYAKALAVPTLNVLAGRLPPHVDRAVAEATLITNLKIASHVMQQQGIQTVFEAVNGVDMPQFLVQSLADMQRILQAVNHPNLAMQYDCYHMAMMGEDVWAGLQHNIKQIKHIQFADCPGRHEPGTGQLNLNEVFNGLKTADYRGYCGAEYRPLKDTLKSFAWRLHV